MTSGNGEGNAATTARELVFAVCHELGNLLAGVRLEAALIEPAAGPDELTRAAAQVEGAVTRAGSLLALVRPLLAPDEVRVLAADPLEILDGLRSALDAGSDGRVTLDLKGAAALPRVVLAPTVMHHLLLSAIFCGLEAGGAAGRVRVSAAQREGEIAFEVADSGQGDIEASLAPRGQGLAFALARALMPALSGRFAAESGAGGTRATLAFPAAPD